MQEPDHASGKQMQRCYAKSLAADALLFMQPYSSLCAYVRLWQTSRGLGGLQHAVARDCGRTSSGTLALDLETTQLCSGITNCRVYHALVRLL